MYPVTQVEKRIPYQALLRRRPSSTSSSVPVTPLKTRPAWATVGPKPPSDTWQASMSLQNSPVKAVLPQHSQAEEEEDWPDLSHLKWEGGATGVVSVRPEAEMDMDVMGPTGNIAGYSKQGKMNSHFADQNMMKQGSLQQRPRWGSPNALPSRPHSRAVSSGLASRRQNLQSSHLLQATHHSRLNSAAIDEQSWHRSGNLAMTHPGKPLHTHISLDSLVSHADRASPTQPWSRGTSELHLPAQQPARFHTSLHDLMAQGIIHDDHTPPVPEQPAAQPRQLSHSRSSQIQQGSSSRYARQLSAPPQRHGLHAPHDWESASAKQGEGEDGRASTAGRSRPSFASPTRSSAAKQQQQQQQRSLHNTSSRSRRGAGSTAVAGAASPAVGSSQAGGPSAPLMSIFRSAPFAFSFIPQGA